MKDKTTWSSQLIHKTALDKVQHTFMIKPLNNLGNYHNIIKAIYDKSTYHNGKNLKAKMQNIWWLYTHTHTHAYIYIYIYTCFYTHTHTHT